MSFKLVVQDQDQATKATVREAAQEEAAEVTADQETLRKVDVSSVARRAIWRETAVGKEEEETAVQVVEEPHQDHQDQDPNPTEAVEVLIQEEIVAAESAATALQDQEEAEEVWAEATALLLVQDPETTVQEALTEGLNLTTSWWQIIDVVPKLFSKQSLQEP